MYLFRSIVCIPIAILLICSCATKRKVTVEQAAFKDKVDKRYSGNYSIDKETGRMKSDTRSQYESRAASADGRGFRGKSFSTESYQKKRWGGDMEYNKKSFAGNTDGSRFKYSPAFVQQQARAQGKMASASGKNYRSQGEYATKSSRFNDSQRIARGGSAYVENQNVVDQELKVINYEDYGKLNVQQTNSLLGR